MVKLRFQLALMMFLEYAVWGVWMPILGATLHNRGVSPAGIGAVFGALYLGCIVTPFIGGQLVDRLMPSQVFLAISHLLAAGAAFWMARQTSTAMLIGAMFLWALLFSPSLGVTNSIAFFHIEKHVKDEAGREREFSVIRTAGTIGWIAAGFMLFAFMNVMNAGAANYMGPIPEMVMAGVLGIVMAVCSLLFVPSTPPSTEPRTDPLAFRKALMLFRMVPGFTMFMLISFIAATEFQFFYVLSGPYLEFLHIPHQYVGITKSISQVTEILALAVLLPLWLPRKGMRWCLLLGSFAWPLRYIIFAMGKPLGLVVASLGLHGFGYAFVLVVQQLYVDRVAPKDIRGSAQNLLTLVTIGVGNFLGSLFCGEVQQYYTNKAGVTNWGPVFVLPAITTLACAVAYWMTFRNPTPHEEDSANSSPTLPQGGQAAGSSA